MREGGNEALSVLIVGFGSIGRRHQQNLQLLGQTDIRLFRSGKSVIATGKEPFPIYTDLDKALEGVDFVVIANPTACHMEAALEAARAGCHLFIEKPLSHSMEHVDELKALVREKNLIAMVGCQFRFHPLLRKLLEGIKKGRLGTLLGARAEWGEYLPDWHPWEDYHKAYPSLPELGGGVILTLIHPLDYFCWFFGPAKCVHASLRKVPILQTSVADDWAVITIEFDSYLIGEIHLDYLQRPAVHTVTVWGDAGRCCWDYCKGRLIWMDMNGKIEQDSVPEGLERNTMFLDEMRHFIECVKSGNDPLTDLNEGIKALKIAMAAKESAIKRRTIQLDND